MIAAGVPCGPINTIDQTFAEPLEGLLKTMHKGTRHIGKVPAALRQDRDLSDRIKLLEKRLGKAIESEDFEEAAILRDEIKQARARLAAAAPPLSSQQRDILALLLRRPRRR